MRRQPGHPRWIPGPPSRRGEEVRAGPNLHTLFLYLPPPPPGGGGGGRPCRYAGGLPVGAEHRQHVRRRRHAGLDRRIVDHRHRRHPIAGLFRHQRRALAGVRAKAHLLRDTLTLNFERTALAFPEDRDEALLLSLVTDILGPGPKLR